MIGDVALFASAGKRSATVFAATICKINRLLTDDVVQLLERFPDERERWRTLAEQKIRAVEGETLISFDFFSGLDPNFVMLLRPRCRMQVVFAGESITKQGD